MTQRIQPIRKRYASQGRPQTEEEQRKTIRKVQISSSFNYSSWIECKRCNGLSVIFYNVQVAKHCGAKPKVKGHVHEVWSSTINHFAVKKQTAVATAFRICKIYKCIAHNKSKFECYATRHCSFHPHRVHGKLILEQNMVVFLLNFSFWPARRRL